MVRNLKNIIGAEGAAKILGLTSRMVRKLRRDGVLSAEKIPGTRQYIYDRRDVEKLAAIRKKNPPRRGPKPAKKAA
jgi:hypothetical protein